ncbi:hypothetical protein Xmau_03733 [Xenorhabdus mauleonii]|uniref:Uncharacterized protein n=1 Tax=Xenorhabdus mauleonii TaxID=351675 RepID=A0A1I3XX99_9GAMM|nr:hypothetical protein [Xenorhabdus mauleonii]PHM37771.1 hypothetical protein Xmau_03733 [Xenorhabdus mauleonii]SFK24277.1 hypothetical protein SAMN05421680_1408 [Xenorhabdus mauleonii]
METTSSQWLFCASQPYCLQITMTPSSEPVPVQLYWRSVRKKASRLYLGAGQESRELGDGDFTVFRLTETQWQAAIDGQAEREPEQWEPLPFTLSELAVHPEFSIFTPIGITEAVACEK